MRRVIAAVAGFPIVLWLASWIVQLFGVPRSDSYVIGGFFSVWSLIVICVHLVLKKWDYKEKKENES